MITVAPAGADSNLTVGPAGTASSTFASTGLVSSGLTSAGVASAGLVSSGLVSIGFVGPAVVDGPSGFTAAAGVVLVSIESPSPWLRILNHQYEPAAPSTTMTSSSTYDADDFFAAGFATAGTPATGVASLLVSTGRTTGRGGSGRGVSGRVKCTFCSTFASA